MSIRWIKNVLVDNKKTTLEIQIGDKMIGDKAYTRLNDEKEKWFHPQTIDRNQVIQEGVKILKKRLEGKSISYPNGEQFDWK